MVHTLHALPATGDRLLVLALCAQWCGTCREFQPALENLARARPDMVFAWADVEDDAELVGDLDIDDFPVLLVARAGTLLHYGVSLPLEAVAGRLIDALAAADAPRAAAAPAAAAALAAQLSGPQSGPRTPA